MASPPVQNRVISNRADVSNSLDEEFDYINAPELIRLGRFERPQVGVQAPFLIAIRPAVRVA